MNKNDTVTLIQTARNTASFINNRTGLREQNILVPGDIKSVNGNTITVTKENRSIIYTYKFRTSSPVYTRSL
jgi:hypothetical protein